LACLSFCFQSCPEGDFLGCFCDPASGGGVRAEALSLTQRDAYEQLGKNTVETKGCVS
jgi:hypothetical protein